MADEKFADVLKKKKDALKLKPGMLKKIKPVEGVAKMPPAMSKPKIDMKK